MEQNPIEIPVILSQLANRLVEKLESYPETMTKTEIVNIVNELCQTLCLESEKELIQKEAKGLLHIYKFLFDEL